MAEDLPPELADWLKWHSGSVALNTSAWPNAYVCSWVGVEGPMHCAEPTVEDAVRRAMELEGFMAQEHEDSAVNRYQSAIEALA